MLKYISFFLFFCLSSYAQDTIYFRSGQITPAKVTEIGVNEIKYYKNSNSDGPLYTESKNEIKKIKYFGNRIDSFNITILKTNQIIPQNKINFERNHYVYSNGQKLNIYSVLSLAENLASTKKIPELTSQIILTRKEIKTKHRALRIGMCFFGAGIVCLSMGMAVLQGVPELIGFVYASPVFIGAGIPFVIRNVNYHKKYKKSLRKVVDMYNTYATS